MTNLPSPTQDLAGKGGDQHGFQSGTAWEGHSARVAKYEAKPTRMKERQGGSVVGMQLSSAGFASILPSLHS